MSEYYLTGGLELVCTMRVGERWPKALPQLCYSVLQGNIVLSLNDWLLDLTNDFGATYSRPIYHRQFVSVPGWWSQPKSHIVILPIQGQILRRKLTGSVSSIRSMKGNQL